MFQRFVGSMGILAGCFMIQEVYDSKLAIITFLLVEGCKIWLDGKFKDPEE